MMANDTAPPAYETFEQKSWVKHSEYYLDKGNLFILVKNTLYRVWDTSFRRHSTHFKRTLPVAKHTWSSHIADGTDEEHPLHLELTQPYDFECLLSIIYPRVFGEYKADSAPQWIAILDLSTRWEFDDIRQLAIKQLVGYKIEPVEKIELEHKCNMPRQWAFDAYIALCSRRSPVTSDEAQRLGIETAVLINHAREKLEKSGRNDLKKVKEMVYHVFRISDPAC